MSASMDTANIMVVDDDIGIQALLTRILEQRGHTVVSAVSAEQAWKSISETVVDLMLLDIRMPDVDGFELCERLKQDERFCSIPVLFLSGLVESEDRIRGFAMGAVDYITKPFHAAEVIARVETHMKLRKLQTTLMARAESSEEMYQKLVESTEDVVSSLDTQGRIRYLSPHARRYGIDPYEAISRSFLDFVAPEDRDRMQDEFEKTLSSGNDYLTSVRIVGPDGKRRWFEDRGSLQRDPDGNPSGIVSVLRDITERKKAEDAQQLKDDELRDAQQALLEEANRSRRALFGILEDQKRVESELTEASYLLNEAQRIANLGHWELDLESGDAIWSDQMFRILGFAPGDIAPDFSVCSKKVVPDDLPIAKCFLDGVMRGSDGLTAECRIKRADGVIRHVALSCRRHSLQPDKPLKMVGTIQDVTERIKDEGSLLEALREITELKEQIQAENEFLRDEVQQVLQHGDIVCESQQMKAVMAETEKVAQTHATALILGETGTGKELLARAIHRTSARRGKPFVVINCAAIPAALIESELFGREKGAFTGAHAKSPGRFEQADGGTVFLDEIGELPEDLQAKLLRVLQEGQFERLGGIGTISVDVRVLAATNRDLAEMEREGTFRSDLYYRLNVFPITIPPLRERREDILPLAWAFVRELGEHMGRSIDSISRKSMIALQNRHWPGNVRELRNAVERAMILTQGSTLNFEDPLDESPTLIGETLDEIQRNHILKILETTDWRIRGDKGAAIRLGLNPSTLRSRMEKLGIVRQDPT